MHKLLIAAAYELDSTGLIITIPVKLLVKLVKILHVYFFKRILSNFLMHKLLIAAQESDSTKLIITTDKTT